MVDTADLLAWKKVPLEDYISGLYSLILTDVCPVVEKGNLHKAISFLEFIGGLRTPSLLDELPRSEKDYTIRVLLGFVREELKTLDIGFEITQEEVKEAAYEYRKGVEYQPTDEERFQTEAEADRLADWFLREKGIPQEKKEEKRVTFKGKEQEP